MSDEQVFRFRIQYGKEHAVRYTSHLDLQRTWERIFRRASLPLAFTHGYHPHPRLNLGLALPLGWTSECELMDVWLTEQLLIDELRGRLDEASPNSLRIHSIKEIPLNSPKLQKQIQAAVYRVQIQSVDIPEDLEARIQAFLNAATMERERRGKTYDLRPRVEDISFEVESSQLLVTVQARPSATGRPDEVLLQLGLDPLQAEIHRKKLMLSSQE